MEKRHQKTPTLTLRCGTACAKVVLFAILFVPAFLTLPGFSRIAKEPRVMQLARQVQAKSKELVKIYSIVKTHRPDVSDLDAWRISEVISEQSSKHSFD